MTGRFEGREASGRRLEKRSLLTSPAPPSAAHTKQNARRVMVEECLWSLVIESAGLEDAQKILPQVHFRSIADGSSLGAAVLAAAAAAEA